jgi:hypothetical protein
MSVRNPSWTLSPERAAASPRFAIYAGATLVAALALGLLQLPFDLLAKITALVVGLPTLI